MKIEKDDKRPFAGTADQGSTYYDVQQVSPSTANALVGGSCYRCVHCGKIVNRDSVKEWIKSWCEQSQKYVRLQKI